MGNELSQPVIIKRNKVLRESEADLPPKKGWLDDGGVYIGEPDHASQEDTIQKTLYLSHYQMDEDKMNGEQIIQKVKLCDLAKMYTGRKTETISTVQPVYCDNISGDDTSRVDMCNNHVEKVYKADNIDVVGEKQSSNCSEKDKESETEEFRATQTDEGMKRISGGENGISKEMFDGYHFESQPVRPPRPSKLAKMRLNVSDFELKGKKYSKPRKGDSAKETVRQTESETIYKPEEIQNVREIKPREEGVSNQDELCDSKIQSDSPETITTAVENSCVQKLFQTSDGEIGDSHTDKESQSSLDEKERSHIEPSHNSHSHVEPGKQCSSEFEDTKKSCVENKSSDLYVKTISGTSHEGLSAENSHVEMENIFNGIEMENVYNGKENCTEIEENDTFISEIEVPSQPLDRSVKENCIPVCEVKPLRVIAMEIVDSNKIHLGNYDATRLSENNISTAIEQDDVSGVLSESRNCESKSENSIPMRPEDNVSEEDAGNKKDKKSKVKYNTFSRKVAAIWAEYPHGDTVTKESEATNTPKKEPKVKKSNSFWKYLTYHETPKKSKERQKRKKIENGISNSSAFKKVSPSGQHEMQRETSSDEQKQIVDKTPVIDARAEEVLVMMNEVYVDTSDIRSVNTSNNAKTSIDEYHKENGHLSETVPQSSVMLRETLVDKNMEEIELSDTIVECKINGTESGRFKERTNMNAKENELTSHVEPTLVSDVQSSPEIQENMEPISAKEKKERKATKRNNSISAKISDFFLQDFRRRSSNKVDKRQEKVKPERRRKHSSNGSKNSASSIEESTIQEVPEEVTTSDRTYRPERISGISKFLSLSSMNLAAMKDKKPKRRKSSSTMDIAGVGVNDVKPSDEPRQRPKSIFDEDIEVTIDEQKDDVVSLSSLSSDNDDEGRHKVEVHVPKELPETLPDTGKGEPKHPSVETGSTEVEVPPIISDASKLNSNTESEIQPTEESAFIESLKEDSYVCLRVESNNIQIEDILTCSGNDGSLKNTEPVTDLDDDDDLPSDLPGANKSKDESAPNDDEKNEQTIEKQVYVSSCTLSLSSPLYNLISEGEDVAQKSGEQELSDSTQGKAVHESKEELDPEQEHKTPCDTTSYDYEVVSPPTAGKSSNSDRNLERFGLLLAERDDQISSETKDSISPSSDTDIVRTLSLQELHVQVHVYDEIESKRPIIYRRFSDRDERDVIRTAPDGTDGKRGKKKKRSRSFSDLFKKSNRRKAQWKAKRKSRDDTTRKTSDDASPTTASSTSSIVHM